MPSRQDLLDANTSSADLEFSRWTPEAAREVPVPLPRQRHVSGVGIESQEEPFDMFEEAVELPETLGAALVLRPYRPEVDDEDQVGVARGEMVEVLRRDLGSGWTWIRRAGLLAGQPPVTGFVPTEILEFQ